MDSCHTHFVISWHKLKFEKKVYGELRDYTWKVVMQILVKTSPLTKLQQTYMGSYRTIHEKLSCKFCNDFTYKLEKTYMGS